MRGTSKWANHGARLAALLMFVAGCDQALGLDELQVGCVETTRRCVGGGAREVCDERGVWVDLPLCADQACVGGECVGECAPGSVACLEGANATKTCNAQGQWEPGAACVDQTCILGSCTGVCASGQVGCDGKAPRACDALGQWQTAQECEYVCTSGQCSCESGQKRCNANALETCNIDGSWGKSNSCGESTCSPILLACIGECAPGTRCLGETPQHCNENGQWSSDPLCEAGLHCKDGRCVVECTHGDRRCAANRQQTCDASGAWQDDPGGQCVASTCDPSTVACVGVCEPGSRCKDDKTPEHCDAAGQWQDDATCEFQCLNGQCAPCAIDQKRCSGNTPQVCAAPGQWMNEEACAAGLTCVQGICQGECGPGDKRCAGTTPQVCTTEGAWADAGTCSTGKTCYGGECLEGGCTAGDLRCAGDFPQKCGDNGLWQSNGPVCGACVACNSNTGTCDAVETTPCRDPQALAVGGDSTCALLHGGIVKCWGYNAEGELGLGDTKQRGDDAHEMGTNLPAVDLGSGATATAIAAGTAHVCALLSDRSVKCWGLNSSGQLGLGDAQARGDGLGEMGENLPAIDLGLSAGVEVTAIATGGSHTCARLSDGNVKCWGNNSFGYLGLGDTKNRGDNPNEMGGNLPAVDLGLGAGVQVTAIAAGSAHTCALLSDGTVKCWGLNDYGQLGLGDTKGRGGGPNEMGTNLPTVDLGSSAIAIAASSSHTCALLSSGSVKCWGWNSAGGLGLGDAQNRGDGPGEMGSNLPAIDLGVSADARAISAGQEYTCALLSEGALKCWGYNGYGNLGLGDAFWRGDQAGEMGSNLPMVDVGLGATVIAVEAGELHTCALLFGGSMKCWGYNPYGQLGLGDTFNRGAEPAHLGDNLPPVDL